MVAVHFTVNDPTVHKTLRRSVRHWNGFEVMVPLEIRVHVSFPVELIHDPIETRRGVCVPECPRIRAVSTRTNALPNDETPPEGGNVRGLDGA